MIYDCILSLGDYLCIRLDFAYLVRFYNIKSNLEGEPTLTSHSHNLIWVILDMILLVLERPKVGRS